MVSRNSDSSKGSEPALKVGDMCICLEDSWADLQNYRVRQIEPNIVIGPFTDVMNTAAPRTFRRDEVNKLLASPYTQTFRTAHLGVARFALALRDLASSHLRESGRTEVMVLVEKIRADLRFKQSPSVLVEGWLRCCVASKFFIHWSDKRKRDSVAFLELSPDQEELERKRAFAGTLGSELSALSERMRLLIGHTSTVGTYRESLLQTLLKKHLPERYHVATGFVFGCPRQLDVLIYDRVDYPPIFREGDLVVVSPDSVRAVVEVKTDLNGEQLRSSLRLLEAVSAFDDGKPPFFKGIFGFESKLDAAPLLQGVLDFYTEEVTELPGVDELEFHQVNIPFHHLASVCVLGTAYGEVRLERDSITGRFYPALYSAMSATGLDAQAAHFLQALLLHLRFGGLKSSEADTIRTMLGFDTQTVRVGRLTLGEWGPYFALDQGLPDADKEVASAEANFLAVEAWLEGGSWQNPENSGSA